MWTKTMKQLKFASILAIMAFAGSCFAPIEHKPDGAEFHEELSQEEMSRYQGGETGASTPGTSSSNGNALGTPSYHNDTKASSTLSRAGKSDLAAQSLRTAAKDAANVEEPKEGPNFFLGALLVVIGLICAYGIRVYLAKAIPDGDR